MSRFDVSSTHPIIPNAQEYMYEEKYVSISSLDIDLVKNPNPSHFEILLPQDYCNVQSISLSTITFPSNLYNFSKNFRNTVITFTINQPYRPSDTTAPNFALLFAIYEALYAKSISATPDYIVHIEDGLYNTIQMTTELTNKFNYAVSSYIIDYFTETYLITFLSEFIATGQYTQFIIKNNDVSQKLWIGNRSSGFILTNDSKILHSILSQPICTPLQGPVQENTLHSLPFNLGFKNVPAISYPSVTTYNLNDARFFYVSDTAGSIWLTPAYADSPSVHYVQSPNKWSIYVGRNYIFMDVSGFNSLDETTIFSISKQPNISGAVNSAFAKLPIYTNPYVPDKNYYFNGQPPDNNVRIFNPPLNRVKKLNIQFKYHTGEYVDFGGLVYSFTLKFNLFTPQNAKKYSMYRPESLQPSNL